MQFIQKKEVVERQFAAARRTISDEEGRVCVRNRRAVIENLEEQEQMLRTKTDLSCRLVAGVNPDSFSILAAPLPAKQGV
ncbi:hypothetical protein [Pantoea piersonii]|uniref:hypothetical protein n=1 Tax=Pantoea piersonii TaxID=2364647 RepID=UPI00289718CD|nr:hypothetical protein [Pantoea piersonii]MDU6442666.1 hypothetical protein [Pantoea sp.]